MKKKKVKEEKNEKKRSTYIRHRHPENYVCLVVKGKALFLTSHNYR